MKSLWAVGLVTAVLLTAHPAGAAWEADTDDKLQVKAARALDEVRERLPRTEPFYEQAYGYAIYPSVTRFGFGFGGAYGKGILVEGDKVIGTTKFWQFTSGIQAGAKNFSMILFFKDKDALDSFKASGLEFMGQAGVAFGTVGAAGTPTYNDGVAIATVTRLGLMGEFTISGAKFTYKASAEN
ncbi:MAG: YSC84-related protein [Woeseiaceae bacterium]